MAVMSDFRHKLPETLFELELLKPTSMRSCMSNVCINSLGPTGYKNVLSECFGIPFPHQKKQYPRLTLLSEHRRHVLQEPLEVLCKYLSRWITTSLDIRIHFCLFFYSLISGFYFSQSNLFFHNSVCYYLALLMWKYTHNRSLTSDFDPSVSWYQRPPP